MRARVYGQEVFGIQANRTILIVYSATSNSTLKLLLHYYYYFNLVAESSYSGVRETEV